MLCEHCELPLEDAQEYGLDTMGLLYKWIHHDCHSMNKTFTWTEKRVTSNNPTGIQSWCTRCRGNDNGPYSDSIKCSELTK